MFSHQDTVTIRFEDSDPAGVVFYPRAIALAHAAVENLIRSSSLGWDEWFASPKHAAPLRHAEADFLQPMRAGETFRTQATVEKLGDTSVTFRVEFETPDGRTSARIITTHVLIEKSTGRPVPLPAQMREALTATT